MPGDFARVEADGRITLLGRGSVCINSGGEKIFPEEVEAAVKSHPDVYDAVVVGVPDERWGSRVAVVVEAREGMKPSLESIQAHCRDVIAGFKIPRQLSLVEQMERSPSGKADYRWAKAIATGSRRVVSRARKLYCPKCHIDNLVACPPRPNPIWKVVKRITPLGPFAERIVKHVRPS